MTARCAGVFASPHAKGEHRKKVVGSKGALQAVQFAEDDTHAKTAKAAKGFDFPTSTSLSSKSDSLLSVGNQLTALFLAVFAALARGLFCIVTA